MLKIEMRVVVIRKESVFAMGAEKRYIVFGGWRVSDDGLDDFLGARPFWHVRVDPFDVSTRGIVPTDEMLVNLVRNARHQYPSFLITGFSIKGKSVYASGELLGYPASETPSRASRSQTLEQSAASSTPTVSTLASGEGKSINCIDNGCGV